ncbi:MAG: virion core protein [Lachnospiraceae bacterium]|nr:virion core protein [Lachnospiraceae bacterium]
MGIIKAVGQAVSGGFADQWLEVYEPDDMGERTVFTSGVRIRKGQNVKGTDNTVSNGSVIHVYDNQFMMLLDGGKVVDYTAEPGYYKVDNSALPSFFNGQFQDTLKESLNRIRFGGQTPTKQQVFYLNLQEIKGIKFGTRNPINYFDNFYNAELFLRAHGSYSIKITDPLKFYQEVIPRNQEHVNIEDVNEQYISEFMEAFQAAVNQMSAEGIRISFVPSKGMELSRYMADILDENWKQLRGMEVLAVGVASISYNEESQKLINMRNEGAMLSDPTVREGYLQGHMARGLEGAGNNANGAMAGFMGMGMAMNAGSGMMGAASQTNLQQMQMNQANRQAQQMQPGQQAQQGKGQAAPGGWTCQCGAANSGKFCSECGKPAPAPGWTCECGAVNSGKFCSECGKPAPASEWTCGCGAVNKGKFCSNCGKPRA